MLKNTPKKISPHKRKHKAPLEKPSCHGNVETINKPFFLVALAKATTRNEITMQVQ
jgi:hypothetical protein